MNKVDMIQVLCEEFQRRVDELNIRGDKRRADAAVTYFVGAATALKAIGEDVTTLTTWISYVLAFRGYEAIKLVLAEPKKS